MLGKSQLANSSHPLYCLLLLPCANTAYGRGALPGDLLREKSDGDIDDVLYKV